MLRIHQESEDERVALQFARDQEAQADEEARRQQDELDEEAAHQAELYEMERKRTAGRGPPSGDGRSAALSLFLTIDKFLPYLIFKVKLDIQKYPKR